MSKNLIVRFSGIGLTFIWIYFGNKEDAHLTANFNMALITGSIIASFAKLGLDNMLPSIKNISEFNKSFSPIPVIIGMGFILGSILLYFNQNISLIVYSSVSGLITFYIGSKYRVTNNILKADFIESVLRPITHLLIMFLAIIFRIDVIVDYFIIVLLLLLFLWHERSVNISWKDFHKYRISWNYFVFGFLAFILLRIDIYIAKKVLLDSEFNIYSMLSRAGIPIAVFINSYFWSNKSKQIKNSRKRIVSYFMIVLSMSIFLKLYEDIPVFVIAIVAWYLTQVYWGPVGLFYLKKYGLKFRLPLMIGAVLLGLVAYLCKNLTMIYMVYIIHFCAVIALYGWMNNRHE